MSSNLLKFGYIYTDDKRIIDSNAAAAHKIGAVQKTQENPEPEEENSEFVPGLNAEEAEALFAPEAEDAEGSVLKPVREEEGPDAQELLEQARQEAEAMIRQAEAEIRQEREKMLEQARAQGYQEGLEKSRREAEVLQRQFSEKEKQLEAEYEEKINTLEPELISALTEVYEHIFRVDFSSYRQIIVTLISDALHHIDGGKNYIVHVSPSDYPYVSLQKAQITANCPASVSVEFTEDITLKPNECLIETDSGIFDCGLGTQLEELKQKIRLLSFER